MWVIPACQSADFVCKMEVLSVYERAYNEKHPVVCLDESSKQLIESKCFMGKDGCQYQDSEYIRHGVRDIYMALESLAGKRIYMIKQNHTRFTWVEVLTDLLEIQYKDCQKLTLVQDDLSAHKASAFYEVFEPEKAKSYLDKIEFVFTPAHGSCLDMDEIELPVLQNDCLNRHIATESELKEQVQAWQERRNNKQAKANWQFTNQKARIKLRKLYPTS